MEEDGRRGLISSLEEENGTGLASFFVTTQPKKVVEIIGFIV
jgi:hypothetical protein